MECAYIYIYINAADMCVWSVHTYVHTSYTHIRFIHIHAHYIHTCPCASCTHKCTCYTYMHALYICIYLIDTCTWPIDIHMYIYMLTAYIYIRCICMHLAIEIKTVSDILVCLGFLRKESIHEWFSNKDTNVAAQVLRSPVLTKISQTCMSCD